MTNCKYQDKCPINLYPNTEVIQDSFCSDMNSNHCKIYWELKEQEIRTGKPIRAMENFLERKVKNVSQ